MSNWRSIQRAATRKRAKHANRKVKKRLRGGLSKAGGFRTYEQAAVTAIVQKKKEGAEI